MSGDTPAHVKVTLEGELNTESESPNFACEACGDDFPTAIRHDEHISKCVDHRQMLAVRRENERDDERVDRLQRWFDSNCDRLIDAGFTNEQAGVLCDLFRFEEDFE